MKRELPAKRRAAAQLLIPLILLLLSAAACNRSGGNDGGAAAADHVDSLVRQRLTHLYTDPQKTIGQLDRLADSLRADTAAWLRVMLWRSVASGRLGDETARRHVWQLIGDYARRHPEEGASLQATAWAQRGVRMQETGHPDSALTCYRRGTALFNRLSPTRDRINGYINMASIELELGRPVAAAEAYRHAQFIADSAGRRHDLAAIYGGLGQVYVQLRNYKEADRYFDRALPLIGAENSQGKFFYYVTRGNSYFFQQRYDEALASFNKAMEQAEAMKSALHKAICDGNIGETLLKAGRIAEAAPYVERGRLYAQQAPGTDRQQRFYLNSLAGEQALAEGRMADAGRLLLHEVDTTVAIVPDYLARHYERLQRYAERNGRWHEALDYQTRALRIDDSLRSLQALNNIAEIESRHGRDTTLLRQSVVIADYKARTSRQNTLIVGITAALLIAVLAFVLFFLIRRRHNERRYRQQLEMMTTLRMNIVQNRMQPHYIFNVLGTVLPRLRAYPEVAPALELLIDTLRSNLLAQNKTAVTLDEERGMVERYVALHHIVAGEQPEVAWSVDEAADGQAHVPAMCLQIPVENALKHAFEPLTAESRIEIAVRREPGQLRLTVTDNGSGYRPGRVRPTGRDTGTGLRMLSRTLELLNSRNAHQAHMAISDIAAPGHGTKVEFVIPDNYRFTQP